MAKKKSTKTAQQSTTVQYDLFGDVVTTSVEDKEDYSTKDKTSPFDIIKMMFQDKEGFGKLTNSVLERNAFMILRTYAIMFPIQAAYLNYTKTNIPETVRYISVFLNRACPGTRVPQWVYTKGSKRIDENNTGDLNITKQQKEQYAIFYNHSMKDVEDALRFNHDAVATDIIRVDKMLNPPGNVVETIKIKSN